MIEIIHLCSEKLFENELDICCKNIIKLLYNKKKIEEFEINFGRPTRKLLIYLLIGIERSFWTV